jgi:thimet oligopeptidase
VEAYDVMENGAAIGRVYLDMFPRAGKYQHFASFSYRPGVAGRRLPEGSLVCNFQAPTAEDPGLMTPESAQTFLHEFGHLLHNVFSGKQKWAGLARPENDFIEAPSQLMEEWFVNPKVLARFAKHYQTGQPIPVEMVQRMRRAERFGEALLQRRQLWLANATLAFETRDSDAEAMYREVALQFGTTLDAANHGLVSWTHIGSTGYAGAYYTYQWSLAIAKDLFRKFDDGDLMDPRPARRYRELVLAPGGSMPAAKLVENFLGRPFNLKAYQAYLQGD